MTTLACTKVVEVSSRLVVQRRFLRFGLHPGPYMLRYGAPGGQVNAQEAGPKAVHQGLSGMLFRCYGLCTSCKNVTRQCSRHRSGKRIEKRSDVHGWEGEEGNLKGASESQLIKHKLYMMAVVEEL